MTLAQIVTVGAPGDTYRSIHLWCPGCASLDGDWGLNMLPIDGDSSKRPVWGWNGDLVAVTLTPSILTRVPGVFTCHSFLEAGVWRFLGDCTHALAGQSVPMVPLPDWAVRE